ncbi:MAG: hypothetical protein AAFN00_01085, partial [Cyanobacteria bacterium J06558_2]
MALAILQFQDHHGAHHQFRVSIGSNSFYSYAIGNEELRRSKGLKLLANPRYTSPLIGPLDESSLGRTVLKVPQQQFNRQNPYIQIVSYRNRQREGIAISEIVKVPVISSSNYDLPAISFSQEINQEVTMENHPIETVPFAYKETQPVSSAMFLGGLVKAISSVAAPVMKVVKQVASPLLKSFAPQIGKVADSIIPGSGKLVNAALPAITDIFAGASPAEILADPAKLQTALPAILNNPAVAQKLSANPKTAQLLGALMQQLNQSAAPRPTSPNAKALAVVGNGNTSNGNNTLLSLEQSLMPGTLPQSVSNAEEAEADSQYAAEMSVSVALATWLPAMMPLMDRVMTRRMRRLLLDDNIRDRKRMALITNGLLDVTRGFRGVRRNYRERDHFYRHAVSSFSLMETESDKQANALVSGLSLGLTYDDPTIDYDR